VLLLSLLLWFVVCWQSVDANCGCACSSLCLRLLLCRLVPRDGGAAALLCALLSLFVPKPEWAQQNASMHTLCVVCSSS
jgi:hypothetical protein